MWKIAFNSYATFHTSTRSCKIGNVMKKVMGNTSKKKRIYVEPGVLPTAEALSKGSYEGKHSINSKRVSVLNKLFMKHISDLLATGEYSSEFVGLGIEINRVQVSPDYNGLNVFWVAKGTENDEVIEKVLKKNSGYLRHELSSLRVMGTVPKIYFVKDKQFAKIMEVESRLAKADFGEDHIPTAMETVLKSQLELFTNLPGNIKAKVENLDKTLEDSEPIDELLPPMPQDVLGLNHADILNRLKKKLRKSAALHRTNDDYESAQIINKNPVEYASNKEKREAFKKFLEQRELLRSKARRAYKKYNPNIEYLREEYLESQREYLENFDLSEEDDYIEDVDDADESKH